MRAVITFLVRKVHWLVFLLLEGVSLTLVVRGNHYQGSVFFTQANVVVAGVQGMERKLLRYAYEAVALRLLAGSQQGAD